MKKSGKGNAFVVILIIIVMIAIGVFVAYKKGYIGKNNKLNEEKEIKTENTTKKADDNNEAEKNKTLTNKQHAIVDFNEDNVLDFITYKEETASDKVVANYTVYSYTDGKVVELGKISGRKDNNLLYKMNDNTILSVYGYMGHEVVKTFTIENNKLVEKNSKDRDIVAGENYTTGDAYIPFDFVTDTIQFEMYE